MLQQELRTFLSTRPPRIVPGYKVAVPTWPVFLRGCLRYRESLEHELPGAPATEAEYE